MSLLQGGAINVAGKRIPISMLVLVAAVGAALLLFSRRSSSSSGISVGAAPVDLTGSDQVLLDQLNSTTSTLQSLAGQLTGTAAAASQGTGTPVNTPSFTIHPQAWGFEPGQTAEPIFSGPSWKSPVIGYVPLGSLVHPTGAPVAGQSVVTDLGSSSFYEPYGGGFISAAAGTVNPT